jgi:hypothetical protein
MLIFDMSSPSLSHGGLAFLAFAFFVPERDVADERVEHLGRARLLPPGRPAELDAQLGDQPVL